MRVSQHTLPQRVLADAITVGQLDLVSAAKRVVEERLTNLPRVLSDRALADSHIELSQQAERELRFGFFPSVEFLAMPKQGLVSGNRPLAILNPQTRTVYEALTNALAPSLPKRSRDLDFDDYEAFGTQGTSTWLVDFDIAACYEFIDHNVLAYELVLQGGAADIVQTTRDTLTAIFGRQIGLPQEVEASHRLSDAYLDIIERGLKREGYRLQRYADDFRVVADTKKDAFSLIELAMEQSRKVHLALAGQKIKVREASEVAKDIHERNTLRKRYNDEIFGDLVQKASVSRGYDDWDWELIEPDQSEVDFEAINRLLVTWGNESKSHDVALAFAGSRALTEARRLTLRVPNGVLANLAMTHPVRLPNILQYLQRRPEIKENWELLSGIAGQERSSPWHKIWLLSTASALQECGSVNETVFEDFAKKQLWDAHEVVRCEAAWFLALRGKIKLSVLQDVYGRATPTSQIGLAAVAGFVSKSLGNKAIASIRNDSNLNKLAFGWGTDFVPSS